MLNEIQFIQPGRGRVTSASFTYHMYHILSGLPWEHDRFHLLTHYRITIGSGRDYTYVYIYNI